MFEAAGSDREVAADLHAQRISLGATLPLSSRGSHPGSRFLQLTLVVRKNSVTHRKARGSWPFHITRFTSSQVPAMSGVAACLPLVSRLLD